MITIRKASLDDLSAIQRVMGALRVPGRPWCRWHTKRMIVPAIAAGEYFVAESKGEVVGAVSIVYERTEIDIATIAVRRSLSGSGIGSRLINFVVGRAKACGKRRIALETFSFYQVGKFYRRTGFRVRRRARYRGATWYEFERRI